MVRISTCAAALGLIICGFAQAQPNGGTGVVTVSNSGNGTGNKTTIDPTAGQKVVVNGSANGAGNTLTVAPDPHGTVVVNASGNGVGNKIIVEEAPGEKVKIKNSGNGTDNNVIIEKVPSAKQPHTSTPSNTRRAPHPRRG